jgi:predicted phage gp36 major capsid-like protein
MDKREQKYRAKQQLAAKFTQKEPTYAGYGYGTERDQKAVRKLVDKLCK